MLFRNLKLHTTSTFFQITSFCVILLFAQQTISAQQTPFELHGKNYTATYDECIQYYQQLDKAHSCISMKTMGMTDAGKPLHVILISRHGSDHPEQWQQDGKIVLLINNGIHPGEPDGIDASMILARDLAKQIEESDSFPEHVAIAVIPVYNIGGCLMRSEYHRPDQNGPEAFGSRGNSQNLDLNRDFIKCDSKEAVSFAEIFHWIQPDIFIDNHVSDGADYQHVMTLATTQHLKLGGVMGHYLHHTMEPSLYGMMNQQGYPMIPYVNVWGNDPIDGWNEFFDGPRYSSGYAATHNVFAFTIETHMLKPYPQRVDATYKLMRSIIAYCSTQADTIKKCRQTQIQDVLEQAKLPVSWVLDTTRYEMVPFKGYAYEKMNSKVSGLPVSQFNHAKPYDTMIKFTIGYKPSVTVACPDSYIVPQQYAKIIELLKLNKVDMREVELDDSIQVEAYKISHYQSGNTQYEGHHINTSVEVEKLNMKILTRKGDYVIPVQQEAKRFIMEVLEPQGGDSYFSWNFMDAILGQKEGYSDYSFEPIAAEYLQQHPELRILLNEKCKSDTAFAKSASAQLDFVYKHTPYAELRHNIYPIYRVTQNGKMYDNIEINSEQNKRRVKEDE